MEPIFEQAGYRDLRHRESSGILILHEAGAGDFVTMSAFIREVRRVYSTAHIILVVEKCAESLAECCPHVDEVITESFMLGNEGFQSIPDSITKIQHIFPRLLNVARKLLRRRIDIAFVTTKGNAPTTPLLAYMSGAKDLISHSFGNWTPLLTFQATRIYGSHTADITLGYLESLIRTRIANRRLEAWFTPLDVANVQSMMPSSKKIYAIGLGGGKPIAHYPPESYAELMRLIAIADDDVKFVIIGGSTDVDAAKILMARVDLNRVVDLVGKISYRQTAAALSLCDVYIGNDTGAMHLAAATQTPVLAPFAFPIELLRPGIVLNHWYPYEVPSVIVCPRKALPECKGSQDYFGCAAGRPHCITRIAPRDLLEAFNLLQTRIAEHITEPILIGSNEE